MTAHRSVKNLAAALETVPDEPTREVQISTVLGLCEFYLEKSQGKGKHPGMVVGPAEERARVHAVELIYATALRDRSRRQAQRQYVRDVYQQSPIPGVAATTKDTNVKNLAAVTKDMVIEGTKSVVAGQEDALNNVDDLTLDVAQTYRLTEAEVLAVKVYTADDYKYINPFVAQDRPWMQPTVDRVTKEEQQKGTPTGKLSKKQRAAAEAAVAAAARARVTGIQEEAGLHAGVAMMALAKLPVMKGTVYRGARMNQAEFDKLYPADGFHSRSLTSTSTSPAAAQSFADGHGGPVRADQTISVLAQFEVDDARDIAALSLVRRENEWVLLPGAKFKIDKIERPATGPSGNPPAKEWIRLWLSPK